MLDAQTQFASEHSWKTLCKNLYVSQSGYDKYSQWQDALSRVIKSGKLTDHIARDAVRTIHKSTELHKER